MVISQREHISSPHQHIATIVTHSTILLSPHKTKYFFGHKTFLDSKSFRPKIVTDPKKFRIQTLTQNCFGPKILLDQQFVVQNLFGS